MRKGEYVALKTLAHLFLIFPFTVVPAVGLIFDLPGVFLLILFVTPFAGLVWLWVCYRNAVYTEGYMFDFDVKDTDSRLLARFRPVDTLTEMAHRHIENVESWTGCQLYTFAAKVGAFNVRAMRLFAIPLFETTPGGTRRHSVEYEMVQAHRPALIAHAKDTYRDIAKEYGVQVANFVMLFLTDNYLPYPSVWLENNNGKFETTTKGMREFIKKTGANVPRVVADFVVQVLRAETQASRPKPAVEPVPYNVNGKKRGGKPKSAKRRRK